MSAMRISTKGRYAVRVMLDLALYGRKEYVKARQIAERQGISEKYLEQIIAVLNRAGFVRSDPSIWLGDGNCRPPPD